MYIGKHKDKLCTYYIYIFIYIYIYIITTFKYKYSKEYHYLATVHKNNVIIVDELLIYVYMHVEKLGSRM